MTQILDQGITFGQLEQLGWPLELQNDYLRLRDDLRPRFGEFANPNGNVIANASGQYYKTNAPVAHWVNPNRGSDQGWIQIV